MRLDGGCSVGYTTSLLPLPALAGGDGMILWHATVTGGDSYSVGMADSGGEALNDNTNDTKLISLIRVSAHVGVCTSRTATPSALSKQLLQSDRAQYRFR